MLHVAYMLVSCMYKLSFKVFESTELYSFFTTEVFFFFLGVKVLQTHYVKKKGNYEKVEGRQKQNHPIRQLSLCISKSLCPKYCFVFNICVFTMYVKLVLWFFIDHSIAVFYAKRKKLL